MRHLLVFSALVFSLLSYSCTTPISTSTEAEKNRMLISTLSKGMTQDKVYSILGNPDKKRLVNADGKIYEVWFYLTKGLLFGQSEYTRDNFTPFVFRNRVLKGWGYRYYDYLLNIDNAQGKVQQDKRQEYTDDREEWPPDAHQIILPDQDKKADNTKPVQPDSKNEEKKQQMPSDNSSCPADPEDGKDQNYNLWE